MPGAVQTCGIASSLRLAKLFRPILFLLLPGSYFFLKLEGSGVRVSAGSTETDVRQQSTGTGTGGCPPPAARSRSRQVIVIGHCRISKYKLICVRIPPTSPCQLLHKANERMAFLRAAFLQPATATHPRRGHTSCVRRGVCAAALPVAAWFLPCGKRAAGEGVRDAVSVQRAGGCVACACCLWLASDKEFNSILSSMWKLGSADKGHHCK
jgi:hypothetical protein